MMAISLLEFQRDCAAYLLAGELGKTYFVFYAPTPVRGVQAGVLARAGLFK